MSGILVHEPLSLVHDRDQQPWVVQVFARQMRTGSWSVWLQFHPLTSSRPLLRTDHDATVPDRDVAEAWGRQQDAKYFQHAFERATKAWKENDARRPKPLLGWDWLLVPPHPHLR